MQWKYTTRTICSSELLMPVHRCFVTYCMMKHCTEYVNISGSRRWSCLTHSQSKWVITLTPDIHNLLHADTEKYTQRLSHSLTKVGRDRQVLPLSDRIRSLPLLFSHAHAQIHNLLLYYCIVYQSCVSRCLPHCCRYPWRHCHWHHWCRSHRRTPGDRKSMVKGQRVSRAQNQKTKTHKLMGLQLSGWKNLKCAQYIVYL